MSVDIPIRLITLVVIACLLSLVALLLRFYARSKTKAKYAADDWLAVVALVTLYVWFAVYLFSK
jgi:nitrate reductase gamma subunit